MSKTYRELIESFSLVEAKVYDKQEEIDNANKSSAKHDHKIGDWTVSSSTHAASQAFLHRPSYTRDHWRALHQAAIDHIEKNGLENDDTERIFFAKKSKDNKPQGQGYVAQIRKGKHLRIITTLEPGVSRAAKPGTPKHLIESSEYQYQVIFLE